MKKKIVIFIVVIFTVVLLAAMTNPSKSEFAQWVSTYVSDSIESDTLANIGGFIADNAVKYTSVRRNYYLFSVYEIGDYKFLGLFDVFIPLNF